MSVRAPAGTNPLPTKRPATRSTLRQSLNLTSVGRALADVMHKSDGKDGGGDKEKGAKKTKDAASRRMSGVGVPRAPSCSATEKSLLTKLDEASPDSKAKTITKHSRRVSVMKKTSATDSDDTSSSPSGLAPKSTITRSSTLRPKATNAGTALPKYRPKSMLVSAAATKKPPSPAPQDAKSGAAKVSEKEANGGHKRSATLDIPPSGGKLGRSASPIRRRSVLKVNLTKAINVRPQSPEKKTVPRPSKTAKTTKTATGVSTVRQTDPHLPSSASSSMSSLPGTFRSRLKNMSAKSSSGSSSDQGSQKESARPSPLRHTVAAPETPPSRRTAREIAQAIAESESTPTALDVTAAASAADVTEGTSTDSIDDVEFMLSTIASPSGPTPILPRLRLPSIREGGDPHTPSRPFLPSRANLSYLTPDQRSTNGSPFLRPLHIQQGVDRGSILSWEQLAKHSKALQDEDIDHMLSEIPAPFRLGAISPSVSFSTDAMPESPSISSLPSPSAYGSISQVLLPDVTPSPAVRISELHFDNAAAGPSLEDAAAITRLRLQLASVETKAQDRLAEIESLESQLQTAKAARLRDVEELAKQISQLEEQVHGNLNVDSERMEYIKSLEEQLRQAQTAREQAVQEALQRMQERVEVAHGATLAKQQGRWKLALCARDAVGAWNSVRDLAECELERVRADREMLSVLLTGLYVVHPVCSVA
ncbi:uncharacterized protein LAESUDRAFT_188676 [Laetiporus sulphureus 93-53]|uniref:Uncharacterized protein n=1 Tax=Laetiporus sulphureus 93-53 TaxID=1314785 RepID=A0A165E5T9_9APHY|nr:uncharacterized protein LAESUDRAFT_188676 [Laetiporus sulphureus 93-53]KZT06293.1 hypothetical protein LAESUDRAFT_188676 [Laetiporus sulphureus 93-53]